MSSQEIKCRSCKKKVASPVKCVKCGTAFHPSCAAQAGYGRDDAFDKFKNEMRTECFENITALTNKVAELSSQHDKHVSELSSLKTEVMELRMESVALRNRMDDADKIDVENFKM
ncbi:hypothetical protein HHI36_018233 [Cryptolaemus montrouzieri]|uniref:Phorbol-ester/DAG-type domain-containing protein n=1 Tax=Cryptolaemus montrouzieri TaxID=559131 RepID=A0ABD2NZE1_9CUCU